MIKAIQPCTRESEKDNGAEPMMNLVIKTEWYSLLMCIFSIPMFESPKSIFLVVAILMFLIRHYIDQDIRKTLFAADSRLGFLALALAAVISAAFAQRPGLAIQGSLDILKMFFLFAVVATDFSDERSVRIIALWVIISTAIASIWGLVEYAVIKKTFLELHSVGHSNHSSIYLALAMWVAVCYFFAAETGLAKWTALLCSMLILAALLFTASRATFLAFIVSAACLVALSGLSRKKLLYAAMAAGSSILIAWIMFRDVAFNFLNKGIGFQSLFNRVDIWNMAWEVIKQHPIVGVGAKHFQLQDPVVYGVIVTEKLSHAHNLFLNILVQYGIIGLVALLFLFYLVGKGLRPATGNFMRPAAFASLIIVIVNGLLNTTMHSEHGLLFALIIGIGLTAAQPCVQQTMRPGI